MFRVLHGDDEEGDEGARRRGPAGEDVLLEEWLDFVGLERQVVIMQLRHYDAILVRHGRLKAYTLPQRVVR